MIRPLHGFLGTSRDWDFLRDAGFDVAGPDASGADVLLGYSMGGRIALEILLREGYRKAVIVSAGLALEDERERAERRAADEAWARRFESDEDWESILRDWNAQPVLGGHVIERRERDYDRAALARLLREWSPGAQEPLAPRLHRIETPILWIAGERDAKYVDVARRAVALVRHAELWICPGAGHRVPWEQPERFVARLRAFLE